MEKLEVRTSEHGELLENKERGASLVEYGILVALIAAVAIVAVQTLGTQVTNVFTEVGSRIANTTAM